MISAGPSNNLSKAIVSSDLFADYSTPTFVRWHATTANTPYKAGLTYGTEGFAIVFGQVSGWHTVIAWLKGGKNMWSHYCSQGTDYGWSEYAQKSDLNSAIINVSNRQYVKITANGTSTNYGVIFVASQLGMICAYNSNGNVSTLWENSGNAVKISVSGLVTTIDLSKSYAHAFVLRGGSLRDMPYEIS